MLKCLHIDDGLGSKKTVGNIPLAQHSPSLCGVLNENIGLHKLIYLNACTPVGGTV